MTSKPNIGVLSLTEYTRDPRVRRTTQSLAKSGYKVSVYTTKAESHTGYELVNGIDLYRIASSTTFTDQDMAGITNLSPLATQILSQCDPNIISGYTKSPLGLMLRRARRRGRRFFNELQATLKQDAPNPILDWMGIRVTLLNNLLLAKKLLAAPPDAVYANDLDTLLAAFLVKEQLQIPIIFDAHEIFSEQLAASPNTQYWRAFYANLEERLIPKSDLNFTVCKSIADHLSLDSAGPKFHVLRNCPSKTLMPNAPTPRAVGKQRTILYHGAYFENRGLEDLITAIADLPTARLEYRGFGPLEAKLKRLAEESTAADRIQFSAPVPVDELMQSAASADIGTNPFLPVCLNTQFALPNKLFEYLGAGLAVASSALPEIASVTNNYNIGALYQPGSAQGLVECLSSLLESPKQLDEMRLRSWQAAQDDMNWENEETVLIDSVNSLLH